MHLKMSSSKVVAILPGLNVLNVVDNISAYVTYVYNSWGVGVGVGV